MPTGYTSDIENDQTFEDFVLGCARAFGALITMRDEPNSAKIPDEIKPEIGYLEKSIDKLKEEIKELEKMCEEEKRLYVWNKYLRDKQYYNERIEKANSLREKYENMLKKVENWEPPSKDHIGIKEFMIDQISKSMDFDCNTDYYVNNMPKLEEDYVGFINGLISDKKLKMAKDEVRIAEEVARAKNRTLWIKQLKESIKNV